MRYFTIITEDHWQPKNALQKEWQLYCKANNRVVLNDFAEKEAFIAKMIGMLEILNAKHKRCVPQRIWQTNTEEIHRIGVINVALMAICAENETAPTVKLEIEFEDNGQDFLRWVVEVSPDGKSGSVITCEPFQFAVWGEIKVHQPLQLLAGMNLIFWDKQEPPDACELRHVITSIRRIELEQEAQNG